MLGVLNGVRPLDTGRQSYACRLNGGGYTLFCV